MYEVKKIAGGFAVENWRGEIEVVYRNRKHAEQYARGSCCAIFNEAELYNDRFDAVRAYLNERKNRVYVPAAQMELF